MRVGFPSRLAGVLALAGTSGCGLVLGLGDYEDAPEGGGGSAQSASTTGSGASSSSGGGVGAGGEGGQPAMVCLPGEKADCYSGAAGTEGVGLCHKGQKACNADGTAYGACEGEVVPGQETCANTGDEDCDGLANEEGPDCACLPGSKMACYTGDPLTKDVGICHAGTQLCKPDGMGYGACEGEQTPEAETCNTPEDDDCDGQKNEEGLGCVCVPSTQTPCYDGAAGTEGVGNCKGGSALCDSQGTSLGACQGEVVPAGAEDCQVIGDENCDGILCADTLWVKQAGDATADFLASMAVDSTSDLVVVGSFSGTIDLGGGAITSAGGTDVFVAKYAPGGMFKWAKRFGDVNFQQPTSVTIDPADNIVIAGTFTGTVDFGGGALTSQGANDLFVAKLNQLGNHVWSKRFGDANPQDDIAVATDSAGNVLLCGGFHGSITLGGPNLTSAGSSDVFLAKLAPTGNHVASKRFGDNATQGCRAIAADSVGSVWIAPYFQGTMDLGGGVLTAGGFGGIALGKFDATLAHVFSEDLGDGVGTITLVTDASDDVIAGGSLTVGGINFGTGAIAPGPFVAKLQPNGTASWSQGFTNFSATGGAAAVDGSGNVVLVGGYGGTISLGGFPFAAVGGTNLFVAKFPPGGGSALWARSYGSGSSQFGTAVTTGGLGAIFVGGVNKGTIDMGTGALTSVGTTDYDVLVAKLAP